MTTKADFPSSSSSSSSSSSPPPFRKFTYDVFLSFRGEDTRKNFTDNLYAALKWNGIHTFRDDEELERGKSIAPELFKAIEESRYVIVVLSRNYANSSWCLDEIAKIVECKEETTVLPVFYDVDPSDVRNQTGDHFGGAFSKHEEDFKDEPDKVTRWRRALSQLANLAGWDLRDGYESKDIGKIVEKIFTELNQGISISEGLVGMDSHLNEMLSYLDIGCPDVRIIGVCGMGGIGKTTIAHVVFETVKAKFDGVSFLENVREVIGSGKQGVVHLQEQLLFNLLKSNVNVPHIEMGKNIIRRTQCTRRVLIVLDDVDDNDQLEALCDRTWFGPGSRIILTSRDERLLSAVDGVTIYKVNPLSEADALKLFRMKAFQEGHCRKDFLELSKEFLEYANGLPLAIKVLGGSVKGRSLELWSSALDRLKQKPDKKINDVLKDSFDGLQETEKIIFLDIACFFKGHDRYRVTRILQGCDGYCPKIDIEVLIEKSLVTLFGRKLWMHDLIQTMGRDIVLQQYPNKPEKRSRLWVLKEIIHVIDRNKATSAIESILLQDPTEDNGVHSINDSFSNMDRLRLLKIKNVKFSGNIKYLSNELQYLEWHECPLDSFPSNFRPDNLVELHMYSSCIKQLWRGEKGWRMLRLINLSGSQYLTSTPDFTQVPDLEILKLKNCTSLVEVHPSLGFLKKLICLNMRNCKSVESIPPFTSLESLKILNLSFCSGLKMFPKIEGNMESLLELDLEGTSIEELPPSVKHLAGLTTLNLTGCSKIVEIPENLNCMESLEQLHIGGIALRDSSFLVGMKNLKSLSLPECEGEVPRSLLSPTSLPSLTSLIDLNLRYCNLMDGDIPDDLSSLISLRELDLSGNCFVRLPESFSQLAKLETLYLRNCKQLELVPKKRPLSLGYVHAEGCTSLTDYPNQIIVLTSVESGVTTINSLIDSSAFEYSQRMWYLNNGESTELHLTRNKHTEVRNISLPGRVYHEELERSFSLQSTSSSYFGTYADDNEIIEEIEKWFSNTSTSNPISIPIVDKNWKGVAMCAVISVNTTDDVEFSNYCYQITVETDVASLEPFVIDDREIQLRSFRSSSNLCLVYYAPCGRLSKRGLNESTVVRAKFETNNPFVVVQKCGIRLLYEQDAGWNFANNNEGKYFTCQNNAVLLSGWLSRGDKCLNWEKCIPPSEEEYSTHVLRKNIESILPRYLEASNDSTHVFKFNLSGSPAWFHNEVGFCGGMPNRYYPHNVEGTDEMMFADVVEIPQYLHKSKEWMGFAIQASIAEEVIAEEEKEDNYRVYLSLATGFEIHSGKLVGEIEYVHNVGAIEYMRSSHDQLLVVYIPRAQLPEALFAETPTTKMLVVFMINGRHVKFQTIGVRVVFQEDIQGLADAIIQCMQRANSLELYDKLVIKEWIELIRFRGGHLEGVSNPKERDSRIRQEKEFELHSQKYRNRDWSAPHHLSCNFYGAEITKWKWFMHIEQGNSTEITLPPNLLDDANWLGIAICAFSRLCPKDRNQKLSRLVPDSEYNAVTCRLDCDGHLLHKWRPFAELDASGFAKDVTWFLFLPRSDIWFKSGKMARATFSWSSQYLTVQSCALGLVYNKDVEHLVHTLTSCELPANYLERAGVTCESNLARQSTSSTYFRIHKSLEWFGNTSTSNHISIPMGDNKWKGVATYTVFSVNMTADAEFSNYSYKCTPETDAVRLKDARRFSTNKDEDFTCENNVVLLSGWLSRGDKCLNWEKCIPPSEEKYSTHVLRKNMESVLPRYLEASNRSTRVFKFNLSGSPAWFHNEVGFFGDLPDRYKPYNVEGTDVMIFSELVKIPQNLHKSKKWMGFAIQASIAKEVIAEEEKKDNYRVFLQLTRIGEIHLLGEKIEYLHDVGEIEYMRSSPDQLLVVYIPRSLIPEALFAETSTTKMLVVFNINSRHVKFQTIGVRVVYQQDIQGLADAIIHCVQRSNTFELYDKLVVKEWIELIRFRGGYLEGVSNPKERDSRIRQEKEFELHSQKYRNRDWSATQHLHCNFYGAEITKWKWFMHIEPGNSAEITLPPNLLDDANWLGIAICAFSRLCPKDRNKKLGRLVPDSEYNAVTCSLDCDGVVLPISIPCTELDASGFAKDVTWFLFLPRSDKWLKSWRQCKLARATFPLSSQYLTVQSCALGLVYKKDVEHLVHTLTSCELPANYLERAGVTRESNLANRDECQCFTCRKKTVLSGWVSRGDKCLNWEKCIHVLRKNMESVLPKFLEALNDSTLAYKFSLSGSPASFHNEVGFFGGLPDRCLARNVEGTDVITFSDVVEIPQNLHKSKKWMGFAIQASIAEGVIAEEEKEDNCRVYLHLSLATHSGKLDREIEYIHDVGASEYMRSSHDQILVVYIPRAQLPEALFAETPTTKMAVAFTINSRHVKFQTIGVRVVFQEDIQGLADAIIQCMQRANSLELYKLDTSLTGGNSC